MSRSGDWRDIATTPPEEDKDGFTVSPVIVSNGEKVGEAVKWFGEWRWANASCSCCWGAMHPEPDKWMPLPELPA